MLDAGLIQPSCSDWASPVCLVRKRCGGVHVCTDHRGLNRACVKDAFSLPIILDCLDTLSGKERFSNIDIANGYYQAEVENEDRYLTAFITNYGLFEYIRMPFGLSNGPAKFQCVAHLVLAGLSWRKTLAYLDDVTTTGKNFENTLKNLSEVLGRLADHKLKSKPKKCHLFIGAHRDFSTTSHSAQFHTQVKLQHRRFILVKLQRSTFAASMQKQLPKLTAD